MPEKLRPLVIPSLVAIAAALATLFGLSSSLDWKLYDQMLHVRKAPVEDPAMLLVDIDDPAIAEIGTWPIGRDVIAGGLATLGEFGAKSVTFDIEYVDPSPRGIDGRYLSENVPEAFAEGFGSLSTNIQALFDALAKKQIPLSAAECYVKDLTGLTDKVRDDLLAKVREIASDNDTELGRAALYSGQAYFTVNMRRDAGSASSRPAVAIAEKIAGHALPPSASGYLARAKGILPTISPILQNAAGAGFPNVYIDPDGVRRRIDLFYEYNGKLYAQLVMEPILAMLGPTSIDVEKSEFVLKGAKLPSGEITDITIPRTDDGRMLIDWPHKSYLESFRHLSFRELVVYDKLFGDLAQNLRIRDNWGYYSAYQGSTSLAAQAAAIQERRRTDLTGSDSLPPDEAAQVGAARDALIAACKAFLATKPEDAILAQVNALLASGQLDAATRSQYETIQKDAPSYFAATRGIVNDLATIHDDLARRVGKAFCVIGYTATGTTDIGVNPFSGEYVNVGTHAATFNTILHRSFIVELPSWVALLLAIAISFALAFIVRGKVPALAMGIGLGTTVVLGGGIVALFTTASIFLAPALPILSAFVTFLSSTIVDFLRTEREKGFLRNAFSHYLSTDVIKEIVANPEMLKLGGTKRVMTAMFTDIRGFSTVSEKLAAEDLVRLLNRYLTGMSDVILDLKGTIDKYEGDAIIAFFGAPLELPDHAARACSAAVRMKRIEAELNARFLSEGIAPSPLLTRVGINTGEMVVGNMGTDRKMDYTIIGDAVNLAARLEGVNKQYGTWVCVAEETMAAAGKDFIFRRLDKIRVVGKSKPVILYELVEEKGSATEKQKALLGRFDEALRLFEDRDWARAKQSFQACFAEVPDDGPSKTYIGRCDAFILKPPAADWDGVYNLTMK